MVFGWGKKRKEVQARQEAPTEGRNVGLAEVASIAEEAHSLRSKTLVSEMSALHSQMGRLFVDLEKIISRLDGDDLKIGDVDRNVRIIVERGKKQVIKIAKEESEKPLPKVSGPEDAERFVGEARRSIKRTGDALGRHSRVINLFAKKYAERIKAIMRELESALKESTRLFEEAAVQNEAAAAVRDGLEEIRALQETSDMKKSRSEQTGAKALQTAESIKDKESKIAGLKSGKEYAAYELGRSKLADHEKKMLAERQRINGQFTKISRPLSKYEYVSALDKERKSVLDALCSDPYAAVQKESVKDVQSVLSAARAGVVGGTVSVKDVERSAASIDEVMACVPGFAKSLRSLKGERARLSEELAGLFDIAGLESLESSASHERRLLEDQKSLSKSMLEESRAALQKIPETTALLGINLRKVTGVSYTVTD